MKKIFFTLTITTFSLLSSEISLKNHSLHSPFKPWFKQEEYPQSTERLIFENQLLYEELKEKFQQFKETYEQKTNKFALETHRVIATNIMMYYMQIYEKSVDQFQNTNQYDALINHTIKYLKFHLLSILVENEIDIIYDTKSYLYARTILNNILNKRAN